MSFRCEAVEKAQGQGALLKAPEAYMPRTMGILPISKQEKNSTTASRKPDRVQRSPLAGIRRRGRKLVRSAG